MTDTTAAATFPYPATRDMRLGLQVKDAITGLIGITSSYNELLTGTLQYYVQPQIAPDGPNTIVQGDYFDWQCLDVIGLGVSDRYDPIDENPEGIVKLGEKVRNLVNGFEGHTIMRQVSINGCIRFSVESIMPSAAASSNAENTVRHVSCDWKELERIDEGVSVSVAATPSGCSSLKMGPRPAITAKFK